MTTTVLCIAFGICSSGVLAAPETTDPPKAPDPTQPGEDLLRVEGVLKSIDAAAKRLDLGGLPVQVTENTVLTMGPESIELSALADKQTIAVTGEMRDGVLIAVHVNVKYRGRSGPGQGLGRGQGCAGRGAGQGFGGFGRRAGGRGKGFNGCGRGPGHGPGAGVRSSGPGTPRGQFAGRQGGFGRGHRGFRGAGGGRGWRGAGRTESPR
ncbi:MAG: hypothetical protein GY778_22060 [bacterium]|nr:hypothetical protein [bacterium]